MIRELDTVVLSHDLKEYGLTRGDVGAVVHCYADNIAFEVEFVTGEGKTIAVVTLSESDVRPMQNEEILHVPRSRWRKTPFLFAWRFSAVYHFPRTQQLETRAQGMT